MSAKNLYYTLNTGANIPMVGLGTSSIKGQDLMFKVINDALQMGYRLFDTAALYENEKDIGYALEKLLPKYGLTRKDIFITTKLHPGEHGPNSYLAITNSLRDLNCGYIDLYLINWPGRDGVGPSDKRNAIHRDLSWQNMIYAMKRKLVKSIGVCSYTVRHLEELLSKCHGVKPAVNQVEFHPFCRDRKLLDLCEQENIFVQGYGTLGGGKMGSEILSHEIVTRCCDSLGKTPAQILLRWSIQQRVGVIPKSTDKGHLFSNMQIDFTIPHEDMVALSTFNKNVRYDRDPNAIL